MTVTVGPLPFVPPYYPNLIDDGYIWTYTAGTTTPQVTYTDMSGTSENTNPIYINAAGYPETSGGALCGIFLDSSLSYQIVGFDSSGTEIFSQDNITSSGGGGGDTGVTAIYGTSNQIAVSANTGNVTLSLPSSLVIGGTLTANSGFSSVYSSTTSSLVPIASVSSTYGSFAVTGALNGFTGFLLEDGGTLATLMSDGTDSGLYSQTNASWLFYHDGTNLNVTNASSTGGVVTQGDITAYSDIRLKTNIETIKDPLSKILHIDGITYERLDSDDKTRKTGVIAQQVENVLPEVIYTAADGMKSVAYGNMVGLLIEGIKEIIKRIDKLESS